MRKSVLFSFIMALVFATSVLWSSAGTAAGLCRQAFGAASGLPMRDLREVRTLRLMTYNLKDFFLRVGRYARLTDQEFQERTLAEPKPEEDVRRIANKIRKSNSDVVVLEEVGGLDALSELASRHLNGRYKPFLIRSNDGRGLSSGFMIKADLPLSIEVETHRELRRLDPAQNRNVPLFARDLPALILRRASEPQGSPLLIVLGVHGKAKKDRIGDPESAAARQAEIEAMALIFDHYTEKYGPDVPIVLAGDFNRNLLIEQELGPLSSRVEDAFDIMKTPPDQRITFAYMGASDPRKRYQQLDGVLLNRPLSRSLLAVRTVPDKDENGRDLPLPTTPEERRQNISDHRPVIVDLSTDRIFPEAHGRSPQQPAP